MAAPPPYNPEQSVPADAIDGMIEKFRAQIEGMDFGSLEERVIVVDSLADVEQAASLPKDHPARIALLYGMGPSVESLKRLMARMPKESGALLAEPEHMVKPMVREIVGHRASLIVKDVLHPESKKVRGKPPKAQARDQGSRRSKADRKANRRFRWT